MGQHSGLRLPDDECDHVDYVSLICSAATQKLAYTRFQGKSSKILHIGTCFSITLPQLPLSLKESSDRHTLRSSLIIFSQFDRNRSFELTRESIFTSFLGVCLTVFPPSWYCSVWPPVTRSSLRRRSSTNSSPSTGTVTCTSEWCIPFWNRVVWTLLYEHLRFIKNVKKRYRGRLRSCN